MIRNNLATIIVDMQRIFLSAIDKKAKFIETHHTLIDYTMKHKFPLFVLEFEHCGPTIRELRKKIKHYKRSKIIRKLTEDGFEETLLLTYLKKLGIQSLIIGGVYSSMCVGSVVKSALREGYKILTSKELIKDPEGYEEYPYYRGFEFSKSNIYTPTLEELLTVLDTKINS